MVQPCCFRHLSRPDDPVGSVRGSDTGGWESESDGLGLRKKLGARVYVILQKKDRGRGESEVLFRDGDWSCEMKVFFWGFLVVCSIFGDGMRKRGVWKGAGE